MASLDDTKLVEYHPVTAEILRDIFDIFQSVREFPELASNWEKIFIQDVLIKSIKYPDHRLSQRQTNILYKIYERMQRK
jgi:hypothetical protein